METFAKEPKLAKLFRELKPTLVSNKKKVHWFSPHGCNGKFAVFWVLFCGITCKWVLFFYHRFIFLLACIDRWKVYNTLKTAIEVQRLCVSISKNGTFVGLVRSSPSICSAGFTLCDFCCPRIWTTLVGIIVPIIWLTLAFTLAIVGR